MNTRLTPVVRTPDDDGPTARYEIVTRDADSTDSRDWTNDGIGGPNRFTTAAEAWSLIDKLRQLGDDWAGAVYDVRRIGD